MAVDFEAFYDAATMAEAYVKVQFDVGDSNPSVTFVRNVTDPRGDVNNQNQFKQIVSDNWTSKNLRSRGFWVTYLLGAFQEGIAEDNDPNSEREAGVTVGMSLLSTGGALIYIESSRDTAGFNMFGAELSEQDTVMHEVAHLVAFDEAHPVTGADSTPVGAVCQYVDHYLDAIRWSRWPAPRTDP